MLSASKRIFIIDEHPVIVAGLRGLIDRQPEWSVAGHAESCMDALEVLERATADLILLEPAIHGMDGLSRLAEFTVRARVLCFSSLGEHVMAERILREGARGFLMKSASSDEILEAMRTVLDGGVFVSSESRQRLIGRIAGVNESGLESHLGALSNRELQIVHLIGANRNSRQIARMMHVSEKTVATHRLRIREKLSLRNTNELVRIAARWAGLDALS